MPAAVDILTIEPRHDIFPTMWHFDINRLRRPYTASF